MPAERKSGISDVRSGGEDQPSRGCKNEDCRETPDSGRSDICEALQIFFGYSSFILPQEEIISEVMAGRDVFALLPTGGGKSLCYQLPALLLRGIAVVVSPLIALMKDQVDRLKGEGIAAAYINSSLSFYQIERIRSELLNDKIKILYVAPERLVHPEFLSFLSKLKVALIAVDEAHCISEWGQDFRPAYRQLKVLKERFPQTPMMALTATAVSEVQRDVIKLLGLKNPAVFRASFNRKNLFYQVRPKQDAYRQVASYLRGRRGERGIIYCFSQKSTEELAMRLCADGFVAMPYHAGLDPDVRAATQEAFIEGHVNIVVATIAFGMGIDKPDIRFVIHYDLPKNLETYYQETGRAGRDGKPSDCILFFSFADIHKIEYLIDQGSDASQKAMAHRKLEQLLSFCNATSCRRRVLLEYFGERMEDEPNGGCARCDNCRPSGDMIDATSEGILIASCVSEIGERFGSGYVVDVLRGSKSRKLSQNGHNKLNSYGSGMRHPPGQWLYLIREMIRQGYLRSEGDRYPVLKVSPKAEALLAKKESFSVPRPSDLFCSTERPAAKPAREARADSVAVRLPEMEEDGRSSTGKSAFHGSYDGKLFQRLIDLRKRLSEEDGISERSIFPDAALQIMAALMPSDHGELSTLCDAGRESIERYGSAFLKTIKDHGAGRLDGSLGDDPGQSQSSADGGVLKRAFLLKQEMNVLKERLDRLSKEHEECIRDALQMEVEVEGEYRMEKVVRMIREVDVALFRKAYPSEFLELAVVHVGAAEKAIGRKELGPLLKARERTYYHVVKRE